MQLTHKAAARERLRNGRASSAGAAAQVGEGNDLHIYTPLVRVISMFVHALTHRQEWISPTAAISHHARGLGICGDVLACMHTVATHLHVASYSTNTAMLPLARRLQANTQLSKVWLNVLTK